MGYDIDSIESLSFKDGVRKRVQMYLGSNDIEGTYQALKEVINNSTDEALAGYGKVIKINISEKDNYAAVRDEARGIPFGVRDDGENVLVSICSKSHTGGKFTTETYKNASGLNGIGLKCVCLTSKKFEIQSMRDGRAAIAYFEKGELIYYNEIDYDKSKHGTYIRFMPDEEVFSNGDIGYSYERVCSDIKDISYLYPGLEFIVTNDDTAVTNTYCAKSGIIDFVKDNVSSPLNPTVIYGTAKDEDATIEIAFQWGVKHETPYVFVNGLRCPELGTPVVGARVAITKVFNNLTGKEFDGEKIRDNLFYVINCKVANPSFANQTKTKINNANLRTLAANAFSDALKMMNDSFPKEFSTIVDLLVRITKAEEAADRAREAILNYEKKENEVRSKKILMPDKFKDCEKHGDDAMLVIVEGETKELPLSIFPLISGVA